MTDWWHHAVACPVWLLEVVSATACRTAWLAAKRLPKKPYTASARCAGHAHVPQAWVTTLAMPEPAICKRALCSTAAGT